jgi:dTDP-4-dehydrorhamnose reductase
VILLLGGTGYVGTAFLKLLAEKRVDFRNVSRREIDYSQPAVLRRLLIDARPNFLINCAGYTGKPNVDACELHKAECLQGNAVLPGVIREACEQAGVPWGHVSSGCIYTGCRTDGSGFTEEDPPNFSFRTNNCSFYSGCKALGEECLQGADSVYIWRLRIPFDNHDSPRNYLSKLMRYDRLLDATNSISHLDEFVSACWETWARRVPFGTYNITNTGSVTARQVVELIRKHLGVSKAFQFFETEEEFMRLAAKTPRSNCVLDNSKLLSTGIPMRDVEEAIEDSLKRWQTQPADNGAARS